jgi:hypothetical protein
LEKNEKPYPYRATPAHLLHSHPTTYYNLFGEEETFLGESIG